MFRFREKERMRRTEKEITNRREIDLILSKATVCRIGFIDNEIPYIVPLNFGYSNNCLYFHSAPNGKKIELLKKIPWSVLRSTFTMKSLIPDSPAGGQRTMKV
jgi:nitroimidazol reductase NimA-like FMN-containing flavoprotein (pyridoxamine 5'-phosphate oxidase superfamily)